MALSFLQRIVEERIREAEEAGAFKGLAGQGKPLALKEDGWVPEELRVAYRILKNAHLLTPEVELRKEIHSLWDLLKTVDGEG
ncbi:MAG TPA: DnaJ family domain-containing protein [Candidatus Binatia bacterium]